MQVNLDKESADTPPSPASTASGQPRWPALPNPLGVSGPGTLEAHLLRKRLQI